jgi:hypothetical protein
VFVAMQQQHQRGPVNPLAYDGGQEHPAVVAAAPQAITAAVQYVSLRRWLSRHAHRVQGVRLQEGSWVTGSEVLLNFLMGGMNHAPLLEAAAAAAAGAAAAASAGIGGSGSSGGMRQASPTKGVAPMLLPMPLKRLHLSILTMTPQTIAAIGSFTQLEVLAIHCEYFSGQQQLVQALSHMGRLRKLALHTRGWQLPLDLLVRSLPHTLTALVLGQNLIAYDLRGYKVRDPAFDPPHITINISSLAHLKHLSSLVLDGMDCVADPSPGGQQQQYGGQQALGLEQQQQQQQPPSGCTLPLSSGQRRRQQSQWPGGAIKAVSVHVATASSCFAPSSLVAVEVFLDLGVHVSLAQLAACPHLRQLRAHYYHYIPHTTGVSALTQLTRLRLEIEVPPPVQQHSSSAQWAASVITVPQEARAKPATLSSSSVWKEVAALKQLQLFEVPHFNLEPTQLRTWLPQMSGLTQLAVLVCSVGTRVGAGSCKLDEQVLEHLRHVLDEWRGSSAIGSSSARSSSADTSAAVESSSSSGQAPCAALASPKLRMLQLLAWSSLGPAQAHMHYNMGSGLFSSMQEAAAELAAALPWLQVECDWDAYCGPCWRGCVFGTNDRFGTFDIIG